MYFAWTSGDDLYVWDNMREGKMVISRAVDTLVECLTVQLAKSAKERLAPKKWGLPLFGFLESACQAAKMGDNGAREHALVFLPIFLAAPCPPAHAIASYLQAVGCDIPSAS
jgi:hypothetical protein